MREREREPPLLSSTILGWIMMETDIPVDMGRERILITDSSKAGHLVVATPESLCLSVTSLKC